jgi:hypothetical protein
MAPPSTLAVLPKNVLLLTVVVPPIKMAPPLPALLPLNVELATVREPAVLMSI